MDQKRVSFMPQLKMESQSEEDYGAKLLRAQAQLLNHIFGFINTMSLKCAIDLYIPNVIHKYGQPMPLSQLIASLPIHPSKTGEIHRLMRVLTHSGFFNVVTDHKNEPAEVKYELTDVSRLLLKDHPFCMTSFLHLVVDPVMIKPWYQLSTWFTNEDPSPFHTQNGIAFWDYAGIDTKFSHLFNDAMAGESQLISSVVVEKCKGVFQGLESLVDVGGGIGTMAKAIANSFPELDCVVFDLPHVVSGLQGGQNLKYIGGDMFQTIPPANSILLKFILHDWNDEECVKILKKCKEAIMRSKCKCNKGKVIIIDAVMGNKKADDESTETKILSDMQMMVILNGKERNEKEWSTLFSSAGFSQYIITPILGYKSLIEVY